jgi:putative ABC transport system substrate-binding protein
MGILYDPNDPSSSATMPLIREYAKQKGFDLIEKPVHSTTEVTEALPVLNGKVDFIFTADDVTVTKSFPALVAYAVENKIPLFAGDYSSVQRGAIAAVGQNYYDVGLNTAKLIIAAASGKPISSLPVQYTEGGDIYINLSAAEKMGVSIPDSVRKKAKAAYNSITEGE